MPGILTSWKEIAQHLGKGVRTVQRWETEGLPVRRLSACNRGHVMAVSSELDAWVEARRKVSSEPQTSPPSNVVLECRESIDASRNLRFQQSHRIAEMLELQTSIDSRLRDILAACRKR